MNARTFLSLKTFYKSNMDEEKSEEEGESKNRQCSNEKSVSNSDSQNNNTVSGQVQNASEMAMCIGIGHPDSSTRDYNQNQRALPPIGDQESSSQFFPLVCQRKLSLNGTGTANGAGLVTSPVNAVGKASSTGNLPPSPQFYVHCNKPEHMASSAASDFMVNFPALICSGCLGLSLGNVSQLTSTSSANSTKTANGESEADFLACGQNLFTHISQPGPSPPHNQGQVVYNWQSTKMSVKERLAYLYSTGTMSDIQFKV